MTPFMSLSEINTQLTQLVRNERKLTYEILTYINLFETCGGHLKMGYASMHQYLTKHLGYSDDQAFRRLKAARLIRQMPEVSSRIQEGSLNLSQAAQAQNAFDLAERTKTTETPLSEETKKSVIAAIEKKNNFETQQILASSLDLPTKSEEHTRPQADRSVRMQLTLSQKQFEKLKSVKSWLSHKIPNQGTAEVLEYVMDHFLAKKQGLETKEKQSETQGVNSEAKRKTQSTVLKKQEAWSASKKQVARKESKKQDVSIEPERKAVTSEPKKETLTLESKIEAQAVKAPSTHSTLSEKTPMSKTTSTVADHSEKLESCDHFPKRSDNGGSFRHTESAKKAEARGVDLVSLFKRADGNDNKPMTKITLETRRQCGKESAHLFGRTKASSRYITVKAKQEVWRRAGGCCEHRNANGQRCQSRYQLQFDHVKAHANGGANGSDNLQLFCRTHNLWKATQEGIGFDSTPLFSFVGN